MNTSAKYHLYASFGFLGNDFLIFFLKFSLSVVITNSEVWATMFCLVKDYSRNISVKRLSEYLQ